MADEYDFDDPEEALTEIVKILESETLLNCGHSGKLEGLWKDAKDIRGEFRDD